MSSIYLGRSRELITAKNGLVFNFNSKAELWWMLEELWKLALPLLEGSGSEGAATPQTRFKGLELQHYMVDAL